MNRLLNWITNFFKTKVDYCECGEMPHATNITDDVVFCALCFKQKPNSKINRHKKSKQPTEAGTTRHGILI